MTRSLGPPNEVFGALNCRLSIGAGTAAEARLREVMPALTVERDGELLPRYAEPNPVSIIWWVPAGM